MTSYFSDTFNPKTATEFALLEEIKHLRARLYVTDRTFAAPYLAEEPVKLTATKALPETITLRKSASLVANIVGARIEVRAEGGSGDAKITAVYTVDTYACNRQSRHDAIRYVSMLNEDFQRSLAKAIVEGDWK